VRDVRASPRDVQIPRLATLARNDPESIARSE
jgi:hypothetical protein